MSNIHNNINNKSNFNQALMEEEKPKPNPEPAPAPPKEEDKSEEEKADEKEYLPSFNLLDPSKAGSIPIDSINDLLSKLETSNESKSEKLKEYPNGKQAVSLADFVKEIRTTTADAEKFERAMKYTFKLFDAELYNLILV